MTERDALLAAILSSPGDDTPRLIYADWLEDRGEVERAEFIRVQCELARIGSPKCNQPEKCYYANACEHGCGGARRDELIHRERELLKTNAHRWWDDQNRDWLVIRVDDDCEICFGQEIPGNGRTLLRHGKTVRGFIASITLSWADFLRHHAALIWSPRQTVECDNCEGAGEFTRENSDPPYGPCPDCGGRMWSGPYLDPDDHGWDKGTGRIPRPFVNTAQPIETVRLTTWPVNIRNENQVWVAEYRFDRVKCGVCGGDGSVDSGGSTPWGEPIDVACGDCHGNPLNLWECEAWPGVEFVMPE